jgi:hypothetical protein
MTDRTTTSTPSSVPDSRVVSTRPADAGFVPGVPPVPHAADRTVAPRPDDAGWVAGSREEAIARQNGMTPGERVYMPRPVPEPLARSGIVEPQGPPKEEDDAVGEGQGSTAA